MPQHPKSILFNKFKGLNNNISPESTPSEYLKKVLNIDIDKTGGLSKRQGYSKKDSGSFTSLWTSENGLGCYANRNGNLVRVNSDYSFIVIRASITSDPISFDEVDGVIYYSSSTINGMIVDGLDVGWGLPKNLISPSLVVGVGTLSAGDYQVSFTYVRSDGIESGTTRSSIITVPFNSGISVSIPNTSEPGILYARVYCSTPDGNTLYYSGIATLGSTYLISSISSFSNPLRLFGLDKAPLGHIVKYYRGGMYVASDNILWHSEPLQYQHFNLVSNFFEFPERIREVMPVEDGIWVCSDRLYYLSGESPDRFKRSTKEHIKVVAGTSTKISGSYLHMDNTPAGYKWLVSSDLGIFVLFNQGLAINLTSENVELESANSGAAIFLQDKGINQYLSILKTNQNPNNSVMGDLVETSIVRNGITLP